MANSGFFPERARIGLVFHALAFEARRSALPQFGLSVASPAAARGHEILDLRRFMDINYQPPLRNGTGAEADLGASLGLSPRRPTRPRIGVSSETFWFGERCHADDARTLLPGAVNFTQAEKPLGSALGQLCSAPAGQMLWRSSILGEWLSVEQRATQWLNLAHAFYQTALRYSIKPLLSHTPVK